MVTKTSAPGKVILLGEHAAVYGNPVLVAAINLRTYVIAEKNSTSEISIESRELKFKEKFPLSKIHEMKKRRELSLTIEAVERVHEFTNEKLCGWDIAINSEIPVASGLGSSASLASALVLAISKELGVNLKKREIANLAWQIENIIHKKSSGVDPFAVTFGGIMLYRSGKFTRVKVKKYPEITIGDTGISSDTGTVVLDVMKLKEKFPKFFNFYLRASKEIVISGRKFLEKGDMENFGKLMNINHGLLSAIGVSHPKLEELVWAARKNSLGAKICGAGKGGIIIALGNVSKEIEEAKGKVIKTEISDEGVRVEFI
ncbi:MAG: mevalonate kinase [Candidatus Altiarchaeota archaeon]